MIYLTYLTFIPHLAVCKIILSLLSLGPQMGLREAWTEPRRPGQNS